MGRKGSLKSKRGSFSILFVIVCLVAVFAVTAFVDILSKTYMLNEIQSIMDVAGTSALQAGIDQEKLREEKFVISEAFVKNVFRAQVYSLVPADGANVKGITINSSDMRLTVLNGSWGLGTSSKSRPQAVLDTVARVRIRSSSMFDTLPGVSENFYRSLSKDNFVVDYAGTAEDGTTELIIRSVSRIVYR